MSNVTISKKIVGYKVLDNTEPSQNESTAVLQVRGESLDGKTYKIKSPLCEHALYVTINDKDGKPYEVFINSKDVAHFAWVTALTRTISAVFRSVPDPMFLVEELKGVYDPKGGYLKKGGVYVPSLVAEIGSVIEKHLKRNVEVAEVETKSTGVQCPKCLSMTVVVQEGCKTCLNCGDSKCG